MNSATDFKTAIAEAENIIVIPHVNPDGDTISSALALTLIIEKYFKKNVTLAFIGKIPDVYGYLPNINKFINVNDIGKNQVFDVAIAVDVASKDRMNGAAVFFDKAKINVNIDHHRTNNNYGKINIVSPKDCSAGQVIFDIMEELELPLTEEIAICLYTSILTDTGGFKYENTSIKTLETAAKLVAQGVNPCELYRACYESKPQKMVQFQAFAITNAHFLKDGKIAYTLITNENMKQFDALDEYTEGISEALRQIKTVEVSMVLKETNDNYTKVSLRSKNVDVSKVASNFNGGGHRFAAGCTIKKPVDVALNKLLEYLTEEIK